MKKRPEQQDTETQSQPIALWQWIEMVRLATPGAALETVADLGDERFEELSSELTGGARSRLTATLARLRQRPRMALDEREDLVRQLRSIAGRRSVPPSRQAPLDRVRATLRRAADADPAVVLVCGRPGMGKTHLWSAWQATLPASEAHLYVKASGEGERPLTTVASIAREVVGRHGWEDASAERLTAAFPNLDVSDTTMELLEHLAGGTAVTGGYIVTPATLASQLAAVLGTLIRHMPGNGPTTLVIDDVQWIDTESLDIALQASRLSGAGLICIGRPEAKVKVPRDVVAEWVELEPLAYEERLQLLQVAAASTGLEAPSGRYVEWAASQSNGNPLALVEAVRLHKQHRTLESLLSEQEIQASSVLQRLQQLGRNGRRVVTQAALLGTPLPSAILGRLPSLGRDERAAAIAEGEAEELIRQTEREEIVFTHDTVAETVRERMHADGEALEDLAAILRTGVSRSEEHSEFAVARWLRSDWGERPVARRLLQEIELAELLAALMRVSESLLARLSPGEALGVCTVAISIRDAREDGEGRSNSDAANEPGRRSAVAVDACPLDELAHRAAYYADDARSMSRYYTRCEADPLVRNRMRELWITRCFSKRWITGAWRIGLVILSQLAGLPLDPEQRRIASARARQRLRRSRPSAYIARARKAGEEPSESDKIIGRTVIRLLKPAISIEPSAMWLAAWIILERIERFGVGSELLIALVHWTIALSYDDAPEAQVSEVRALARQLLDEQDESENDASTDLIATVYARVLSIDWYRDTSPGGAHFLRLYERSVRVGNAEGAGDAASLHSQWLLQHGYPLGGVFQEMDYLRRRMAEFGYRRIEASMQKYQQAVEVLLGLTDNPLQISGSLGTEADMVAELVETSDTMALAGMKVVRVMVSALHDAPDRAVRAAYEMTSAEVQLLPHMFDANLVPFYVGMCAARIGAWGRFRHQLRALRPYRRHPAGGYRYVALRAELAWRYRLRARARSLWRRAARDALAHGHPQEAAFIAERHGSATGDLERLQLARVLYEEWGAQRAVRRVTGLIDGRLPQRRPSFADISKTGGIQTPLHTGAAQRGERATAAEETLQPPRERELLHLLFATVPDALLLVSAAGTVLLRNAAAEQFVISEDEGHPGGSPELLHPDVRPFVTSLVSEAVGSGQTLHREREKEGAILSFHISPALEPDAPHDAALVVRDVTSMRDRERKLILADRLSSLGLLAATVAHEVSNPNHVLQLNAQSLEMLMERSDPVRESPGYADLLHAVRQIQDGSQRIAAVVQSVLAYAREGHSTRWEETDAVQMCHRVITFTRPLVAKHSRGVALETPESAVSVRCIRSLVEQALINLIKNAAEASRSTGSEICLAVERRDGFTVFLVGDQGGGFKDPEQPSVTAFSTSRAAEGGTGLGLTIVRSVAETHGGGLRFTSNERYTTVAELWIPVAEAR